MDKKETVTLSKNVVRGFLLFGIVIGFIIGNSKTSVSAIAVSSLLGFMATIVSVIIEGKGDINRVYKNLNTVGKIFFYFSLGMLIGIFAGSCLKGNGGHIFKKGFSLTLPPISSDVSNP